jgi:uncharacterized protein
MTVVTSFPHDVHEIETLWIPMPDGCRLAARAWLPDGCEEKPVPAVFEYIPYRRRDITRPRDEPIHRYFAGNGLASLRVDMRGSGDSDGLMCDEYEEQEQLDAVEVIAWLARQPWCAGNVGMFGKSWGGINALQVAARRPPELKSILSVCATDNTYFDNDHYLGGCLTDIQMVWGTLFLAQLRRPPDPAVVGERWRAMWQERLANDAMPLENWFRHQRYDEFWKRTSICEDYGRITCGTFLVGGWLDGFSSSIFRMLNGLRCPRRALVGPWGHLYPHDGKPGPAVGFLQEAVRWWEYWLKGIDNGAMDEPMLRVWQQDSSIPDPRAAVREGRWVEEPAWPSPNIATSRMFLNGGTLDASPAAEIPRWICSTETVGLASNYWHSAFDDHQAADQREEDGCSLCFDSAPLAEPLAILGGPMVTLQLSADRRIAMAAVRLTDVSPDGASLFVSFGILNLSRRDSHERPEFLEPGRRYRVRVQLEEISHRFAAGHRIRVAVSTSYWHRVWPMPERATLEIVTGASFLDLPVRWPRPEDENVRSLGPPEQARSLARTILRPAIKRSSVERDLDSREVRVTDFQDNGIYRIDDTGLEVEEVIIDRYTIRDNDPLSAAMTMERRYGYARGDWRTRVEATATLTSTADAFRLRAAVEAFEGNTRVDSKTWDSTFPRDLL